jgi:peptide-methionine (S)-S-oxide reductase
MRSARGTGTLAGDDRRPDFGVSFRHRAATLGVGGRAPRAGITQPRRDNPVHCLGILTMVSSSTLEIAVLGGGCFWCLDAVFRDLAGVETVESGYAGGRAPNPTYEEVCSGGTGHAEVVRVAFDPAVLSFRDLLRVFFTIHDPTTRDRQGNDVGTQYRSVIFCQTPQQRSDAEAIVAELTRDKLWPDPIVTQIAGADPFYPAEGYHQDYFERNGGQPYCAYVVAPKVAKFRKAFADRLRKR